MGCVRRDPLEGPEEKQRDMLSMRGEKPFVGRLEKGMEEALRPPREGGPQTQWRHKEGQEL